MPKLATLCGIIRLSQLPKAAMAPPMMNPQSEIGMVRRIPALVTLLCVLYFAVVSVVCTVKYLNFGYDDFDLAVHSQSVWKICRGDFDSSILGIPFLGNHMALILFLVAPLYFLFPSPLLLLSLQTAVLAAGAWAVFMIARDEISEKWGLAFAAAYLIYPPLFLMNLYEFHPVALASTFLMFAWLCYRRKRFAPFLAMLLLAMLCQENISLIAASFGVYAWLKGRRNQWAWAPLILGTAFFIIEAGLVMPRLNQRVQFYRLYAHLGSSLPEIAQTIILHPFRTACLMLNPERLQFFNLLLAPLGYLSLLSPLSMIPAAPVFLQRLLSARATESAIIYHYQAEFIPFVFPAAILGLKRILGYRSAGAAKALATGLLAVFPPLSLLMTLLIVPRLVPHSKRVPEAIDLQRRIVRSIPPERSVVATFEFLAPLSNRHRLYSLHHIYTGRYTLSTVPYPVPGDADVVLINTDDYLTFHTRAFYGPDHYLRLQKLLQGTGWKIAAWLDPFLAFERTPGMAEAAPCLVSLAEQPPAFRGRITQKEDVPVVLRGFSLGAPDSGNIAEMVLFWEKKADDAPEFTALCVLSGKHGTVYSGHLAPGSRIWPPQSWPCGRIVADRHRIRLKIVPADNDEMEMKMDAEPLF